MSELKPCPFCGSDNVSYCVSEHYFGKGDYEQERYITCPNCSIRFSYLPSVQDLKWWGEFKEPQEKDLYVKRVITAAWNNRKNSIATTLNP